MGLAVIAWANEHSDERVMSSDRLVDAALMACREPAHIHPWQADQYQSFATVVSRRCVGSVFLQRLYEQIVAQEPFGHDYSTPHPLRLHVSRGPLHPVE
jgi:hypothetical protein